LKELGANGDEAVAEIIRRRSIRHRQRTGDLFGLGLQLVERHCSPSFSRVVAGGTLDIVFNPEREAALIALWTRTTNW